VAVVALDGIKVLDYLVDLEADLVVEFLTMEEADSKVNSLDNLELMDMDHLVVADNIHTTAQAVEEHLTAVNLDHQEMVVKVETVETEDQRELQVQQDQAVELVDLGVEHHLEDQVVAEMVLLELVNLDQMVKVAVAEAVALDNHLLEAAEMVS
jgi:hypothetical protein|tara:strand:+ start:657 stop:1118 length:462 start_codon:yes stop_codon:yes gene_type:complete